MAAPTNPLLPNCDAEQELPERSSLQEASSRRGIFGYKLSNDSSVIRAFKDAFYDLTRIGKKSKDSRPLDWCFIRRVLWASCWNLSVLGLLVYLCLVPLMDFSDEEDRCQPDGEFRFDGINQLGGFDWWAPRGFFQITLGWGRLSFGSAKFVDVTWDLVSAQVEICYQATKVTGCWSRGPNSHGFCIMGSVCPISPTLSRYEAGVLQHSMAYQDAKK